MRWRLGVSAVMICVVGMRVSYAQCDDPRDGVLCAATLTQEQVRQFSATDDEVSSFWAGIGPDYVELVAPGDCYPGSCDFSGPEDASMTVKVAATAEGM
ncbi:MAG: hypothetical protein GF331_13600, partial [Chitinivibrionales bacterium]|nr:hypothetical protein [Chitinivibrionales bacterium]